MKLLGLEPASTAKGAGGAGGTLPPLQRRAMHSGRHRWARYGFAAALAAAVLALTQIISPQWPVQSLLVVYAVPVGLAAWLGGIGPGILATLLITVAAALLAFRSNTPGLVVSLLWLAGQGILISALCRRREAPRPGPRTPKAAPAAPLDTPGAIRAALQSAPLFIGAQDRQLRYTWGHFPSPSQTNLVGKTDAEIFPPDQAARLMRIKRAVLEHGRGTRAELTLSYWGEGGEPRHISLTVEPIWNEDARLVGITTFGIDTTDQHRVQRRLAAEHAVIEILARAADLPSAAPRLLQAICERLDYTAASLWNMDESGHLRCIEFWSHDAGSGAGDELEHATRSLTLGPGEGLPGRAWISLRPVWASQLGTDTRFIRRTAAVAAGVHSCLVVPIAHRGGRGTAYGVMEFFSEREEDPESRLLTTASAIGAEIAQFLHLKQLERLLADKEAHLLAQERAASGCPRGAVQEFPGLANASPDATATTESPSGLPWWRRGIVAAGAGVTAVGLGGRPGSRAALVCTLSRGAERGGGADGGT